MNTNPEQDPNLNIVRLAYEGMVAEVNPVGGFVESFSDVSGNELLFPRQDIDGKNRGGVPVCAPTFGSGELVGLNQHGFARNLLWERAKSENPNEVELTLVNPRSQAENIPEEFTGCAMEMIVTIEKDDAGNNPVLRQELTIRNYGPKAFACTPGFHPYFPSPPGGDVQKVNIVDSLTNKAVSYSAKDYAAVQEIPTKGTSLIIATPEYQVKMETYGLNDHIGWSADPEKYFCVEPTYSGKLESEEDVVANLLRMGGERKVGMQLTWQAA